jgi:methionyl-tRNA formyltransferase
LNRLISENKEPKAVVYYRDHLNSNLIFDVETKGIQIYKIEKFYDEQAQLEDFIKKQNVDFYLSVAFQFILPKSILSLVKWPINIHTSLLPKYRGHHPIATALLNNEPIQGTTVHLMTEGVDQGEILRQDFLYITNEDNIVTIKDNLVELSYKLLTEVIEQLHSNTLSPKSQVGETCWSPKRTPSDSKLDLNTTARQMHNFIRTLVDPYPNAFGFIRNKRVQFKKSVVSNTPGKVLKRISEFEYIISTADGIIWVETDQQLTEGDIFND